MERRCPSTREHGCSRARVWWWRCFATEQYVHNFLTFSGRGVGPDYEVALPCDFEVRGDFGPAIRRKPHQNVLEFWKGLPEAVKFRLVTPSGYSGPNTLIVAQTAVEQSLGLEVSVPSKGIDLWCTDRQLSPEMLVILTLDPGRETRWTRTYRFSTDLRGQRKGNP